jgi:hypothetical protein
MSNDEKRPSVGKDVVDPPPAPDKKRPNATPPPSNTPNPDPVYPSQSRQESKTGTSSPLTYRSDDRRLVPSRREIARQSESAGL